VSDLESRRRELSRELQEVERQIHLGRKEADSDDSSHHWFSDSTEVLTFVDADFRIRFSNRSDLGDGRLVGKSVLDVVDAGYQEVLRQSVGETVRSGLPQHCISEGTGPDGKRTRYSNWVVALPPSQTDSVAAIIGIDITRVRQVKDTLEITSDLLESVFTSVPDYITLIDRNYIIRFINREYPGKSKADIVGRKLSQFHSSDDEARVEKIIDSVFAGQTSASYQHVVDFVEGPRHFAVRVGAVRHGGDVEATVLISRDITDQVVAGEALENSQEQLRQAQKMEAVGQLTGGIAHDFNNLLTVIMGNLLLAQDLDDVERIHTVTGRALQASESATTLIHRLLAFGRRQTLDPRVVDINALVGSMQDLLERTLGSTVMVEIVPDEALWNCKVDLTQLENALLNLAINARDAMPRGGTLVIATDNVTVSSGIAIADVELGEGNYVRIRVSDKGVGMSEAVLEKAFDPFFTTKDPDKGSGLGLSMVYGFVKQSGGEVRIQSAPGEGTTVEVYFPRSLSDGRVIYVPPELNVSPVRGDGERILVVEDHAEVRRLMVHLLQKLGYRTTEARMGAEALATLEAETDIELVMTDIVLPGGMNGFELGSLVQDRRPGLKVLYVSGYPDTAVKGIDDLVHGTRILQKPFTEAVLAREVSRAMQTTP
jgi:PAS domain S-box-containing protein